MKTQEIEEFKQVQTDLINGSNIRKCLEYTQRLRI